MSPTVTTDLILGIDTTGGVFIEEGSGLSVSLSATGELIGSIEIAGAISGSVTAAPTFGDSQQTAFAGEIVFDDFDGQDNERLYLLEAFDFVGEILTDIVAGQRPRAFNILGQAGASLTIAADASTVPVVGEILQEIYGDLFSWTAEIGYDFATQEEFYRIDEASLPSVEAIEDQLVAYFLGELSAYNPLPQPFRDFLTLDLGLFDGSVTEMIGLDGFDIIINPTPSLSKDAINSSGNDENSVELVIPLVDSAASAV